MAQTNGFLLEAPGGAVLIDAPEGAAGWLAAKGVRVGVLLLTHGHFDHVMDAARIRREHGCPVVAREMITPDLTLETLFEASGMSVDLEAVTVDEVLGESAEISYLGQDFAVLHIPGHSPDSICFQSASQDGDPGEVIFAGDVLFQGSIGRTDFPHGDHALLVAGIRTKLFGLDDAVRVYPGHGPPTTIGEERRSNPFVRV